MLPWLWEEYINSLIEDVFYHPKNKSGGGGQRLFDKNVGLIYPDFLSRDDSTRIIADAKYKPLGNISSSDYHQILSYMFRFDSKTGYFFYPESEGESDKIMWLNSGSTFENNVRPRNDVRVIKHGLIIPTKASSYEEYVKLMKKSEYEFKQTFSNNNYDETDD